MKRVILSVVVLLISSSLAFGVYAQDRGDEGGKKQEKKKASIYGTPKISPKAAVPKATPKDSTKVKMAAEQKKEWEEKEEANFESLDLDVAEASTVEGGGQKISIFKSAKLVDKTYNNKVVQIEGVGVTLDCNGSSLLGEQQVENAIIVSAKNVTVKDCHIKEYKYPIVVNTGADGAKITGNTIEKGRDGMQVHGRDFTIVSNNISEFKRTGISIIAPSKDGNCDDWENGGVIQNNQFDGIGLDMGWVEEPNEKFMTAISIDSCSHGNTVKKNTIKGDGINLALPFSGGNNYATIVSSSGRFGILMERSSKNIIENNTIEAKKFDGILISSWKVEQGKQPVLEGDNPNFFSHENVVKGNTVKDGYDGIKLGSKVNSNTVEGNTLVNNSISGMRLVLWDSFDNKISKNYMCDNKEDVSLATGGVEDWFPANSFSENTCSSCKAGCDMNKINVEQICATACPQ